MADAIGGSAKGFTVDRSSVVYQCSMHMTTATYWQALSGSRASAALPNTDPKQWDFFGVYSDYSKLDVFSDYFMSTSFGVIGHRRFGQSLVDCLFLRSNSSFLTRVSIYDFLFVYIYILIYIYLFIYIYMYTLYGSCVCVTLESLVNDDVKHVFFQ